jgi:hypothetical protein
MPDFPAVMAIHPCHTTRLVVLDCASGPWRDRMNAFVAVDRLRVEQPRACKVEAHSAKQHCCQPFAGLTIAQRTK